MAELRTFIFTDIVRSVALKTEMRGVDDMQRDLAFIESILTPHREHIEAHLKDRGGRIVSTAGDGHFLVFGDTIQAARWAIDVQRRHHQYPITTSAGSRVAIRISLHVGVPQIDPRDPNNFVGKPVDYAARLNDFAQGGQILCSRAVSAILDDVQLEGVTLHSHGQRMLRGIGHVEVFELVYREAGPMDTLYHPVKNEVRQWTIVPPGRGPRAADEVDTPLKAASLQATVVHSLRPKQLGNYELGELLGSGGMGDVFKARHTLFDRVRAVKVIKPRLVEAGRTDIVRRFYQEIKAIGKLEHKNIVVAVESSAPEDHVHYLVMEYIEGISLDDLVVRHGPLSVADACEAIRQAARGLQYIHKNGMVHRDIKPSNLMLTVIERIDTIRLSNTSVADGVQEVPLIKILDLGLALLVDEDQDRLTQFGQQAMGTGMYMSPEQWKTTSVDIRADIYSLGCTLYHLLAGQPPFLDSDLKPEKAHEKSKVPPISGPTKVPRKLWDVIRTLLAKDPAERLQTPEEVVTALTPFCEEHTLVELYRKYAVVEPSDASLLGTPSTSQPHIDTLPIDDRSSRGMRRSRMRRRWVTGFVVFLAVGVALTGWYMRDPPVWTSASLPLAAELVLTLPGMNGAWWFEEVPWLTPSERVVLLTRMRESDLKRLTALARQPDMQALYDHLADLREARRDQHAGQSLAAVDDDPELRTLIRTSLADFDPLEPLETSTPKLRVLIDRLSEISERSPAGSHLMGVLLAHVQDFDEAEQIFAEAERGYLRQLDASDSPSVLIARGLLALLKGDQANLSMARSDFPGARETFASAINFLSLDSSTPLRIYLLGMQSQAGLYDPAADEYELKDYLARASEASRAWSLDENHPLEAFVFERRAHLALETWDLAEAIQQANEAARLRSIFAHLETQSESLSILQGSHQAQQGWFRAKQIVALAAHFQGRVVVRGQNDTTLAKEEFEFLLKMLQSSEGITLTDEQRITWEQLRPNFHGRKADCELFALGQFDTAALTMAEAIWAARQLKWEQNPEKAHFLQFMYYKQGLAFALAGVDEQARRALENARAIEDTSGTRRFEVFREVAEALLESPGVQYTRLVEILQRETEIIKNRIRDRDNRQLMLFVAAYLQELWEFPTLPDTASQTDLKDPQQVEKQIETLLIPLRQVQASAGTNYRGQVQRSARKAVGLLSN